MNKEKSKNTMKITLFFLITCILPLGVYAKQLVEFDVGEAIHIRSLFSHTGAPSVGDTQRYAVELAVKDFGKIHGRDIMLSESVDSMCSPEGGHKAAEQIIANQQVLGVIGTSCSAAAVAASPVISEAGLVMISPSNTSPLLTSDLAGNASSYYYPGYFRVSINGLYQSQAVADFAYGELGLRKMVTLDDGDPYTTLLVSAFSNAFRDFGGLIVAYARIEKADMDMRDVLKKFDAANPDGIFFPIFKAEGIPFVEQTREFDSLADVTLITGAALLVSDFLGTSLSEDIYFVGPESDFGSNVNVATGKNADAVLSAFATSYGRGPLSPYWAHAYDATTLLLKAIESVAVVEGEKLYVDRAALRQELAATSGFQGILGMLSCDNMGDCATGRTNIYHHTDSSVTDPAQLSIVYRFAPP